MDLADRVGADSMRQYLLNSPVIRGEDLHFSDQEVLELQRKNIGRLHNVLAMYEMFADGTEARADSSNVLDQWIVTRLQELVNDSTAGYKSYELDKATRPIGDFIDDLSVWYLRRSRDRLKGEVVVDRTLALATLRHVLRTLALTIAPSMPFYAEYLWQAVREDEEAESVHLAAWPTEGVVNEALLEQMEETRAIVTTALEARTKSGIKVRQPIASVHGPALPDGLSSVVLDELNAKSYVVADTVAIDTNLTPELISEGAVRELMRAVQGKRKANGLEPKDEITLTVQTDDSGHAAITAYQDLLQKTVGATDVQFSDTNGDEVTAGDFIFTFSID
jgi:isoleucyl-tRNA synthetase